VGLDILCIAGHRTEIMDRQCRSRVALNPSQRNEKWFPSREFLSTHREIEGRREWH